MASLGNGSSGKTRADRPLSRDEAVHLFRASNEKLLRRLEAVFESLARHLRSRAVSIAERRKQAEWSPLEILEHVTLANHFLLLLADKIAARTRSRLRQDYPWPASGPRHEHIAAVATDRRPWTHPEHMTPAGSKDPIVLRGELSVQRTRCLRLLREFPDGEGTLHRIRVSVLPDGEDRLDLYQLLDFLGRHAERHLAQIERSWV